MRKYKYTHLGRKVDKQIGEYLELIIEKVVESTPGICSILLAGGFGRGEGSVIVNKTGKAIPQNDFELFLLLDKPIDEDLVNEIANQAIRDLDIGPTGMKFDRFDRQKYSHTFYIDAHALEIDKLGELLPMFRYYELKNASHLLWGEDYRHLMPDFKIADLPLSEGLRLLLNRMAMLCHYFSFDYLDGWSFDEKHGLMYLGNKALIGLGGALTQLNGTYKPTYLGRLKELRRTFKSDFKSLSKMHPDLVDAVDEAVKFKMKPNYSKKVSAYELWTRQKKYIKSVTIYFAEKFFDSKFENIFEVADFLYSEGWKHYYHPYLNYVFSLKTRIVSRNSWLVWLWIPFFNWNYFLRLWKMQGKFYPRLLWQTRGIDLTIFAAMLYILYCAEGKWKISKSKLNKAKAYLEKIYPVRYSQDYDLVRQWEMLKDDFSNAYILFGFMKIV